MALVQQNASSTSRKGGSLANEIAEVWREMPAGWWVLGLVALWTALFHFLGNSNLGYVETRSLFGWWLWIYTLGAERPDGSIDFSKIFEGDEAHAWLIPLVVLVLLWYRREEIMRAEKGVWWPSIGLLLVGVLLHITGYMVQQARVSVVGYFLGLYAITGLFWGRSWMRLALFPFVLFAFCVPLGASAEFLTFPMRLLATQITATLSHILGINVIQEGTLLFDAAHTYQYEVAAACGGLRSVIAIVAFGVVYSYLSFQLIGRRLQIVASAFPLAILGNVFRLTLIVVASEAFGREAGTYVHDSAWFSLAPYLPAFGGMLLFGWFLRENRGEKKVPEPMVLAGVEQKS